MSCPVVHFLVVSPFDVIQPFLDGPPFVTIPVGSIIETQEEIFRSPGLAEIRLDDKPLLARIRDIEEHTKPLDEPVCA